MNFVRLLCFCRSVFEPANLKNNWVVKHMNRRKIQSFISNRMVDLCSECDVVSTRHEAFLDISLSVSGHLPAPQAGQTPQKLNDDLQLSTLLHEFTKDEFLGGDNKYLCEACNHYSEAQRLIRFHELPTILTFHLKRFRLRARRRLHQQAHQPGRHPRLRGPAAVLRGGRDGCWSLHALQTCLARRPHRQLQRRRALRGLREGLAPRRSSPVSRQSPHTSISPPHLVY